jgi:hypothetical protein
MPPAKRSRASAPAAAGGTPPPAAAPPSEELVAAWTSGASAHNLKAPLTHLDVLQTYPSGAATKSILACMNASGTVVQSLAAVGKPLEQRSEHTLDAIYDSRSFQAPALMALGLRLNKNHGAEKNKAPKGKPDKLTELPTYFEGQQKAYEERMAKRQASHEAHVREAESAAAAGDGAAEAATAPLVLRLAPYPLKFAQAKQLWTEAQYGEMAPGLAPLFHQVRSRS